MGLFKETKTYPRIVYNNTAEANSLYNQSEESNAISASSFKITSVEGFYVIAVRDSDGTIIVSDNNKNSIETKSAYIDFYIRSCWFAPSADRPSTISTVIRLYDPSSISANKYKQGGIIINYQPGAGNVEGTETALGVAEEGGIILHLGEPRLVGVRSEPCRLHAAVPLEKPLYDIRVSH